MVSVTKNQIVSVAAILVMIASLFAGCCVVSDDSDAATVSRTVTLSTSRTTEDTIYVSQKDTVSITYAGLTVSEIRLGYGDGNYMKGTVLGLKASGNVVSGTITGTVYLRIETSDGAYHYQTVAVCHGLNSTFQVYYTGQTLVHTLQSGSTVNEIYIFDSNGDMWMAGDTPDDGFDVDYSNTTLSFTDTALGFFTGNLFCVHWMETLSDGTYKVTEYPVHLVQGYAHTVAYDANGGSGSMSSTVVTDTNSGSTTVTLADNTFTRSGYTFAGWYDAASGGNSVSSVSVGANASKTVYAHWTQNTYAHTVVYDANGGTGGTSRTVTDTSSTSTITLASDIVPTRSGYTFAGWYDAASGGNSVSSVSVGANASKTVYAHWIQNTLSIGSVSKQYAVAGGSVSFSASCVSSPSGASVSYSASNLSSGLNVNINGSTVTCSSSAVGTYTFTLAASASNYSGSSTTVTVQFVPVLQFSNSPSAGAINA